MSSENVFGINAASMRIFLWEKHQGQNEIMVGVWAGKTKKVFTGQTGSFLQTLHKIRIQ